MTYNCSDVYTYSVIQKFLEYETLYLFSSGVEIVYHPSLFPNLFPLCFTIISSIHFPSSVLFLYEFVCRLNNVLFKFSLHIIYNYYDLLFPCYVDLNKSVYPYHRIVFLLSSSLLDFSMGEK